MMLRTLEDSDNGTGLMSTDKFQLQQMLKLCRAQAYSFIP